MDQCVCVLFCVRVSDHVHAVHEYVRSALDSFLYPYDVTLTMTYMYIINDMVSGSETYYYVS